jgi:uncharacterized UPF0160 family protein
MSFFQKKKILVTHNGQFHADDLFACATMSLWFKSKKQSFEIIRTRDSNIIKKADFVFDVGGEYDVTTNRYDHHQKGGAGLHENGIPYASFGLAWKHFGMDLCGDIEVMNSIENKIVSSLDAIDNGVDVATPKFDGVFLYTGQENFLTYSPTWKEGDSQIDQIFLGQVSKATEILSRIIKVASDDIEGKHIILDSYTRSKDKRIVELGFSFSRPLLQKTLSSLPDPIYAIYPSGNGKFWKVEAVSKNPNT